MEADALDHQVIVQGDAGKLGHYPIPSVLPDKSDKFALLLYEFHDFRFASLDLPPLNHLTGG